MGSRVKVLIAALVLTLALAGVALAGNGVARWRPR